MTTIRVEDVDREIMDLIASVLLNPDWSEPVEKWTVIATVEGTPVPPHVEATCVDQAIIVAVAAVLTEDGGMSPIQQATRWYEHGGVVDSATVYAVIPGWHKVVAGMAMKQPQQAE
jgi:hypothetical protein